MVRIIFENEGSLDKYVGDAIVAVYGGFIPLDNPTSNAVKTAIDMVNRIAQLNDKWKTQYKGFRLGVGFGIDTGEVFIGNVGSPDRMEFTVIGDAVNTAQYLSDIAMFDQILLSERAGNELGSEINVEELSVFEDKDKISNLLVLKIIK